MAKYIDIEKEITEMQQVVEFYKDSKTFEAEITSFAFQTIIDKLTQVPAADVAPVIHAHWVGIEYDGYADGNPVYDVFECSNCSMEHYGEEDTLTPYCPECGAKMDKEI